MILVAALLVAAAAAMVVLWVVLGGLGWLYGAIATASLALVVLAIGVMRQLRSRRVPGVDRDDADPGAPPP